MTTSSLGGCCGSLRGPAPVARGSRMVCRGDCVVCRGGSRARGPGPAPRAAPHGRGRGRGAGAGCPRGVGQGARLVTAGSARAATTQNMALSAPARQSAKRVRKGLSFCHGFSCCFAIPSSCGNSLAASGLPSCASFPERRTVLQPRTGRFAAWNGLFCPARRQRRGGGMGFVKSFPGGAHVSV